RDHGVNLFHQVLAVDGCPDPEAPEHGERDRVALDSGVVGHRHLDDAVGRGPELELPIEQRDWRRVGRITDHVPGKIAARHEDLALLPAGSQSAGAAAALWGFAQRPHQLVPDAGGLVAHRARVALYHAPCPGDTRTRALAMARPRPLPAQPAPHG